MPRLLTISTRHGRYEDALRAPEARNGRVRGKSQGRRHTHSAERPPVLTMGRSGTAKNILASRAGTGARRRAHDQDQPGGDVTYRGPPDHRLSDLPLAFHGKDVHRHLRRLEAFLIAALSESASSGAQRGFRRGLDAEGEDRFDSHGDHALSKSPFRAERHAGPGAFRADSPVRARRRRIASMEKILGRAPTGARSRAGSSRTSARSSNSRKAGRSIAFRPFRKSRRKPSVERKTWRRQNFRPGSRSRAI